MIRIYVPLFNEEPIVGRIAGEMLKKAIATPLGTMVGLAIPIRKITPHSVFKKIKSGRRPI